MRQMRLRSGSDIPVVEHAGYRSRRYLGPLAAQRERKLSGEPAFGALQVFDDVVIDPGSRVAIGPDDGVQVAIYVLEGQCRIEDDRGQATDIGQDVAACVLLGQGIQHDVLNPSPSAALRAVIAAVMTPVANPRPGVAVASFAHDAPGIKWFASHRGDEPVGGPLILESSVRMGIATLDPGAKYVFAKAPNRGIYAAVLEGQIELDSPSFVDAGGDARMRLDSAVRIQAIPRSRVVLVEVPMGFVQELTDAPHAG